MEFTEGNYSKCRFLTSLIDSLLLLLLYTTLRNQWSIIVRIKWLREIVVSNVFSALKFRNDPVFRQVERSFFSTNICHVCSSIASAAYLTATRAERMYLNRTIIGFTVRNVSVSRLRARSKSAGEIPYAKPDPENGMAEGSMRVSQAVTGRRQIFVGFKTET